MGYSYGFKLFGGGGAGGSGAGTSLTTQVLFNSSGSVAGDDGLTYDAVADTLTVGRVLVGGGSAAAPSVAIGAGGGWYSGAAGRASFSAASVGESIRLTDRLVGILSNSAQFQMGANLDASLRWVAANTVGVGSTNSGTPAAQTLIVGESGAGTDIAGGNGVISSGAGTSDAPGSSLTLATPADSGSTGSVAQTQVGRITVKELHINLRLGDVNVYANNAAALAGGLVAGDLYRTGADPDPVMIVH